MPGTLGRLLSLRKATPVSYYMGGWCVAAPVKDGGIQSPTDTKKNKNNSDFHEVSLQLFFVFMISSNNNNFC